MTRIETAEVEVKQADVTKLRVDAIVNAADTDLQLGGGVAGAIRRAGGPSIQAECNEKAPIGLGESIETTAGEMPARWVIHAATMHLGGGTSGEIIRSATASVLRKADELGVASIGFVALGTGVGGFSLARAAEIMVGETAKHLAGGHGSAGLERIVFCVFGEEARAAFEAAVTEAIGKS